MNDLLRTPMDTRKFASLAVGAHFAYRGDDYIKISPLLARASADGATRMIPRAAAIEARDDAGTGGHPAEAPSHRALAEYHRAALDCLETLADSASPQSLTAAREALTAAHARALARLGKPRKS
ncbi:MAG: hypothetical protein ABR553_07695 [Gammaproteobacteria bacterium]